MKKARFYREANSVQIRATFSRMATNVLRLNIYLSISERLAALSNVIRTYSHCREYKYHSGGIEFCLTSMGSW